MEVKGEVAHVLCRSVPAEPVVSGERGDERFFRENVPVRIDGAADESAGSADHDDPIARCRGVGGWWWLIALMTLSSQPPAVSS